MSKRVLVLGGNGFVGHHAVAALLERKPAHLVIGTRASSARIDGLEEISINLHQRLSIDDWRETAAEFDVILNCVGILRPVGQATYDRVHHLAPKALAGACKQSGATFIHVSALALKPRYRSRFLTSKQAGEAAISTSGCRWMIVRPSLLDGEGGFGASWLRGVSRLPVFAVPMDAGGRIAALTATDLGVALATLCLAPPEDLGTDQARTLEFGGLEAFPFKDYVLGLRRRYTPRPALAIPIPGMLARLGAHLCDLLHFSPFSFGHWELLRNDNVPAPNRLPEILGRDPMRVINPRVDDR